MNPSSKIGSFLTGTLLLTAAGFVSRFLGFFYRIFLSRTIGAEGLGLFSMMHPVFGICFALCSGSVQTAISQYTAARAEKGKSIFRTGLVISLSLSLILSSVICRFSPWIAEHILMEPRCSSLLPFMAFSVPFSAFHACINGYYYGMKKTRVPAFSQMAEQVIRILTVFLLADIWILEGREITVMLAVMGHLIGEAASCLFCVTAVCFFPPQKSGGNQGGSFLSFFLSDFRKTAAPLMTLALPLMGNRLILNLLASLEAVLIPNRLTVFGLTSGEAISLYGTLTGMALPFVLFPSAITNSMAVLLLPTVAEAQSAGEHERISGTITTTLRYSLYMGILFVGLFTLFGNQLGQGVFKSRRAGSYIQVLAWLCPFLYLSTTMGSILNGLGKPFVTFLHNAVCLILRLCFVLFGIPRLGMKAYLWGMLFGELVLALLHLCFLKRQVNFSWAPLEMIGKPAALLLISTGVYYAVRPLIPRLFPALSIISTGIHMSVICLLYLGLLLLFHKSPTKSGS